MTKVKKGRGKKAADHITACIESQRRSTTTASACEISSEKRKKQTIMESFISTLLKPCCGSSGDLTGDHRRSKVREVNHSSKGGSSGDTQVVDEPPLAMGCNEEHQTIPSSLYHGSSSSISPVRTSSLEAVNGNEDDDISLISLGEARELAQLRIDGIGILDSGNATDQNVKDRVAGHTLTKRTLPPLAPLYQMKATKAMRRAIENGDNQTKGGGRFAANRKQHKLEKNVTKKEVPVRLPVRVKHSKRAERLNSWLDETIQSVTSASLRRKAPKDPHGKIAKEHAKIAELYSSISDIEAKKRAKKEKIEHMMAEMEKQGPNYMSKIKKTVKNLKRLDKKVGRLLNEVRTREIKLKQLQAFEPVKSQTPNQSEFVDGEPLENRRPVDVLVVDDDCHSDSSGEEEVHRITVAPAPIEAQVVNHPTSSSTGRISTPTTQRLACKSGVNSINCSERRPLRERLIRRMLATERNTRDGHVERPLGAHPYRVRSTRDNVQEYIPYSFQYYDSDSDDETDIVSSSNVAGPSQPDGMKKFEESQRLKAQKVSSKGKDHVSSHTPADHADSFESDDESVHHTCTVLSG